MRHFLLPRPVTALARGVRKAAGTAVLIARTSGTTCTTAHDLGAHPTAVALTAITGAADHALTATTGTVVETRAPIHRQGPCRQALDLRRSRRDTLLAAVHHAWFGHGIGRDLAV